jgi:uncharacterized protein
MKPASNTIPEKGIDSGMDIYTVPVPDAYLLYSPLRQVSALVNKKALCQAKARLEGKILDPDETRPLDNLLHTIESSEVTAQAQHSGPLVPNFLGIIPTRACNLSCAYCGFGAGTAPRETMDPEMAATAVDWMAEQALKAGQDRLDIHFFGGEPFVAPDVVEVVIHRARAAADKFGLTTYFEVATNGVFNEDQARFVGDYFDTVVLSFDGPEKLHDLHRPGKNGQGSYQKVFRTAERLSRSPTKLCFRVCISQDSVVRMEQMAVWFCETFQPSVINFETLKPTEESEAAGLKPPDPYLFAAHYVRASRLVEGYGMEAVYAAANLEEPRHSFCPVGQDTLIVSPDGRISGCYLPQEEWLKQGLNLDVGRLKSNGTLHIEKQAVENLRRLVTQKPKCERCFCRWTCAGGCHVSHTPPGSSREYNDFCIQTRIITACKLLGELGFGDRADALLATPSAMENITFQATDCLLEWGDGNG